MKSKLAAALALGLAFSGGVPFSSVTQAQTTLRLLNAWDNRYAASPLIVDAFIASVKQASKDDIQVRNFGPEVVPPFEQLQPVSKGAFDLLFSNSGYYIGVSSVSHAVQGLTGTPAQWRQAGIFEWIDKHYEGHNLKVLAIVPTTTSASSEGAFQALLKEPVRPGDKPLAGRKIRGTPTFKPLIEAMGGSLVVLSAPDIYPGLQRGTVDGVMWPVIGAVDFKWYEVAPYLMKPTFGTAIHMLFINLDKFKSLTPAQQKILLAEGEKLETTGQKALEARGLTELEELKKRGMKDTTVDPTIAAPLLEIFKQGFWETAESAKSSPDQAKALHALARSKGMAK